MHPGGACQLGQAADGVLHLFGGGHHQVGQLVDDNDNLGHGGHGLAVLVLVVLGGGQAVVALQVAHVALGENLIALHHLRNGPAQGAGGLAGVRDDRHQHVGHAVILCQFHGLGVDHQETHLVRAGLVEHAHNQGVDAHRLTRACGAGDEQVGHLGQIRDDGLPGDVPAQGHGKLALGGLEGVGLHQLPHAHGAAGFVGHLNAHGGLAGDGRLDAHAGGGQVQCQVVGEVCNLADFHTGGRLDFIAGHGRAAADVQNFGLHAKAL